MFKLKRLFKKKGKHYPHLNRFCPGCAEDKPKEKFRWTHRHRFAEYCRECEDWYIEHRIDKGESFTIDKFIYDAF